MKSLLAFCLFLALSPAYAQTSYTQTSHTQTSYAQTSPAPTAAPAAKSSAADAQLVQLADRYFTDYYFKFNPTAGTSAGFHQYDNQLEDYSKASLQRQTATLKSFKQQFEKIDASRLSPETAVDRELVLNDINAHLLNIENIRAWQKNPDVYSSGHHRIYLHYHGAHLRSAGAAPQVGDCP